MQREHTPTRIRRSLAAVLAVTSVVALAACGDDDASDTTSVAATTPDVTTATGEIAFAGQWARTSPAMATMGAVYVTITSPIDDQLLGGSVDPTIAGELQIHETYVMGPDDTMAMGSDSTVAMGSDTTMAMGSDTTMAMGDGEMGMRPVDAIALPAGTAVALEPGGYHIMLIGLVAPLEAGTTIKVTLTFEQAGDITIDVPVLDEAP